MPNRILMDLGPLRDSRDFRLLFAGQMVNMLGNQLTVVAIPFQVYELTRSSLQVGAVSLAQVVPLVIGALVGGAAGSAVARRILMIATSLVIAMTSGALAVNACLGHSSLLVIYVANMLGAGAGGAYSTACSSVTPSLVTPGRLLAAFATMQVVEQVGMVGGPAVSGLLLELIHLQWVFALDAISSLAVAMTAARMTALSSAASGERQRHPRFREGLGAIRRDHVLLAAYLIDLNAMVFGAPTSLFPALNHAVFGGRPSTLGFLYAAPGAGALLGALTTGWLDRIRRQGVAIVVAVCGWGAAIVAFGLVRTLWVALVVLGGRRLGRRDLGRAAYHRPPDAQRARLSGAGSRQCRWRPSREDPAWAASVRGRWPRRPQRSSPLSRAVSPPSVAHSSSVPRSPGFGAIAGPTPRRARRQSRIC